jgi:hypothetical protein
MLMRATLSSGRGVPARCQASPGRSYANRAGVRNPIRIGSIRFNSGRSPMILLACRRRTLGGTLASSRARD